MLETTRFSEPGLRSNTVASDHLDGWDSDSSAEFDAYALDYVGGTENPVKRLVGGTLESFLAVKVRWLMAELRRRPLTINAASARLLDFGCGTGEMLQLLRSEGWTGELEGCDVSTLMLRQLQARWVRGAQPKLHLASLPDIGLPADTYDVVIACCVFHHIDPSAQLRVLGALARNLRPGGRLFMFEHNSRNPITRWVVARTPIDQHAVLLDAQDAWKAFAEVGLTQLQLRYVMFFPPRLRFLQPLEHLMGRIPLGGQWVLTGEKG